MDLLLVALLLMAVAAVVVVALGTVRGGMAPVDGTLSPPLEEPLREAADLDRARFGLALRGYRMEQVDAVLDEARDLLQAKDEEIDRLRGVTGPVPPPLEAPADDLTAAPDLGSDPVAAPVAEERA